MGAFSYFGPDADLAKRVLSQAKRIARAMYSNPPVHGARIVAEVVGDEGTFNKWRKEMEGMAGRIQVPCRPLCVIAVLLYAQWLRHTSPRRTASVCMVLGGTADVRRSHVLQRHSVYFLCQHADVVRSSRQSVRQELHDHLVRINPDKKWDFIVEQARFAGILCASAHGVSAVLHGLSTDVGCLFTACVFLHP